MSQPAYEKSDVTIRGVVWFTTVLGLSTIAVMLLMGWMFSGFERRSERADAAAIPSTRLTDAHAGQPPQPVLQGAPGSSFELQDPLVEMEAWDREMDRQLSTSGWIDRNAGTVRIPIERAKQLLLERGLPAREGAGAAP